MRPDHSPSALHQELTVWEVLTERAACEEGRLLGWLERELEDRTDRPVSRQGGLDSGSSTSPEKPSSPHHVPAEHRD